MHPLKEKAVSSSQAKFMGLVHADQQGKLKHPSAQVAQAAASIKPDAATEFASTPRADLPVHAAKPVNELQQCLEAIAKYNEYGKALKRDSTLQSVAEQLAMVAEMAENAVVNEADDWFDAHTVKRNMKEIKSYAGDFSKLALEADTLNQRMQALYDDMGRVLERYFEIPSPEDSGEDMEDRKIKVAKDNEEAPKTATGGLPGSDRTPKLGESEVESAAYPQDDETPWRAVAERHEIHTMKQPNPKYPPVKMDELTTRVVKKVHEQLMKEDVAAAHRFARLPKEQMVRAAWRLLK